jgi:hypothetical protein
MKIINKTNLILSMIFVTSTSFASTYEYPQVYKDTRIMGMGGANVALGGQTSSVFYNTAGISDIPKEYGWEVDIFNMNLSFSDNVNDFASDMSDANEDGKTDEQKTIDTLKVTENYLGKNLNFSNSIALLSVGKKFDKYAFAIMPIAGGYINAKTHRGSGSEGIFEVSGISYGGVALGLSRDFEDRVIGSYDIKNISLGLGVKTLTYKLINANLSVAKLIDDNLNDTFEDTYTKDGSSMVFDLGAKAKVYENTTAGISIQNIGSIASENETLEIPMTVNVGLAYSNRYDRTWFNQYQVAADYIDLLQGYSQDEDAIKRTRFGLSGNVFDGWLGTFGAQVGLYQGHPTFGIDLRMTMLKLAYSTYSEEVGAYSGQDADQRHMIQVSLGW